ncbi:uncharacterized protein [Prorops nasuta]|uniref:uncharacterized protein n=1 Tax=Prorops nasuta TaxID=863751 RepID=UPI0034CF36D5
MDVKICLKQHSQICRLWGKTNLQSIMKAIFIFTLLLAFVALGNSSIYDCVERRLKDPSNQEKLKNKEEAIKLIVESHKFCAPKNAIVRNTNLGLIVEVPVMIRTKN